MADSDPVDSLLLFPNLLWETISISQFALGRNAKKMEQLRFMRNVRICFLQTVLVERLMGNVLLPSVQKECVLQCKVWLDMIVVQILTVNVTELNYITYLLIKPDALVRFSYDFLTFTKYFGDCSEKSAYNCGHTHNYGSFSPYKKAATCKTNATLGGRT